MAAEISVYSAVTYTIDGVDQPPIGSMTVPVKGAAASITDGTNPFIRKVKVPAGEMVYGWEWADTDGFEYARAAIVGGEGFIQVGVRYNPPTSSTNLTPTGSINQWNDESQSCLGEKGLTSERAYIHATAANAVGQTNGFPTVWTDGARVLGVADIIAFYNEGDEDVVVDLFVMPK